VPFQLKTLKLYKIKFANLQNLTKFIKTQKSLEVVKLSFDRELFTIVHPIDDDDRYQLQNRDRRQIEEILCHICSLPKLKLFSISGLKKFQFTDWNFLNGITNRSLKELQFSEERNSELLETFLSVLQNLTKIVFYGRGLKFSGAPEVLEKLSFHSVRKYGGACFFYQPTEIPQESAAFEMMLMNFLQRYKTELNELVIGHKDWIVNGFSLSLEFCKGILALMLNLKLLELYNVKPMKQFVMHLMTLKKQPKEVKLYTDAAGIKSVKHLKAPFLEIIVV
jgi:hypothetical protein